MPSQAEVIQHQMQTRASERLISSGDWISAEELAWRGRLSPENAQTRASAWVEQGLLFSIQHEGMSLYPAYALDAQTGYPLKPLSPILEVLQAAGRNGWALAFWFNSPNSYLSSRPPKDCLHAALSDVAQAAKWEAMCAQHG